MIFELGNDKYTGLMLITLRTSLCVVIRYPPRAS